MKQSHSAAPAPAEALPFRLTAGGEEYRVRFAPGIAGGPAAAFDRDERCITVRSDGSAADVVNNLTAAATLMQVNDTAEAAYREYLALLGQVEDLSRLVEAALPARHVVARRFWSALDELTENREPPVALLRDAMDEYDALPVEERRRILNGWSPVDKRPSYADVVDRQGVAAGVHRVLEIGLASRRNSATWDFRLDDSAGVHPVRVLLTAGVTKREVLDALKDATELVANEWDELVGADTDEGHSIAAAARWFNDSTNEKGEAPPMPDVPALAGNRNDQGVEAEPAGPHDSR